MKRAAAFATALLTRGYAPTGSIAAIRDLVAGDVHVAHLAAAVDLAGEAKIRRLVGGGTLAIIAVVVTLVVVTLVVVTLVAIAIGASRTGDAGDPQAAVVAPFDIGDAQHPGRLPI